ncbi:hypothetical protein CLV63_11667 [Murinocardiopsis flavida]|uniref:Uncharacterized protein n=1 Tax=Murinocardiopsis flavida TaxID=645275 RepID=A0A2P8D8V8_9ACTN|nr:hypothetical protein [Murinocardiopsis flavida]PSK93660.1 hypothetical protein CLV63_11667 [Murinocardiopsis flavida]
MVETKKRDIRIGARWVTSGGLVLCALGIATLWLSGTAEFPVALPPGAENTTSSSRSEIAFLTIGALFVALARWRWVPVVGVLLGAVFAVGFFASPSGFGNLTGAAGATAAIGQAVQLAGELTALVAGVLAVRAGYTARRVSPAP